MKAILLVDDIDSKLNELVSSVNFFIKDNPVSTANSKFDAINQIQTKNFDVIFTDMAMEDFNSGVEVLKAAKLKNRETKVFIVTDYENPNLERESFQNGASGYIKRGSLNFLMELENKLSMAF